MKKSTIISILIGVIVALLFLRSCDEECEPDYIIIPETRGDFAPAIPTHTPINVDSILAIVRDTLQPKVIIKKEYIEVAVQENDSLLNAYKDLEDEYERFKLFQNFVSVKQFHHNFEDEKVSININGLVRGKVNSIQSDYTIKEQKIETEKQRIKRFGVGTYFGYDLINLDPSFGVSIHYSLFQF